MSGIETIGIIASASQLAAYGIRIVSCLSQLYKEVSVMPHKIRDHIKQIEKLVETTILIQEHDSLRSPAIHSHLHTTLNEAVSLYNILTKIASKFAERSFWAFWTFLKSVGEKDILNRLSNLEREKSALRLCISLIHTDLLLNIQSSLNLATIGRMAATNGNLGLSRSVSSPGSRIGSENTSMSHPLPERKGLNQELTKPEERPDNFEGTQVGTESIARSGHNFGSVQAKNRSTQFTGDISSGHDVNLSGSHIFNGVTAFDDSFQIAGNVRGEHAVKEVWGTINNKVNTQHNESKVQK